MKNYDEQIAKAEEQIKQLNIKALITDEVLSSRFDVA